MSISKANHSERDCQKSSSSDSTLDSEHVAVNLSFVVGLSKPEKEPQYYETVRDGQRKKIYESLSHSHHYHLRYQLLPHREDQDAKTFKTDMVVFGGVVSKIYTDVDTRVLQGWPEESVEKGEDGNPVSNLHKYCWRHRHKFKVNKSTLLELHGHVLEIQLWSSASKISARARYDRPKAFRLPSLSDQDLKNPGAMELSKRPSRFPDVSHDQQVRNSKGRSTRAKQPSQSWSIPMEVSLQSVQSIEDYVSSTTMDLSREDDSLFTLEKDSKIESKYERKASTRFLETHHQSSTKSPKMNSYRLQRQILAEEAERTRIDKEGLIVLRLDMFNLFSKQGIAHACIDDAVEEVKVFEVFASAGGTIPCHLVRELKPMTLTVEKVSCLPTTPHSHQELSEKCEPVYVQYHFPTQTPFRTPGLPHGQTLSFGSPNVILLGTLCQNVLLEHLRGPPLIIQVHDRDSKVDQELSQALFGIESQDDLIGTHAFSPDMSQMAASNKTKKFYPYGTAALDLSALLSGQALMEFTLPVVRGPRRSTELTQIEHSPSRSQLDSTLPGDYLESGCEITITIELYHPLNFSIITNLPTFTDKAPKVASHWKKTVRKSISVSDSNHILSPSPFNRLVYVISSEGKGLVQRLLAKVNEINAKTLSLDTLSPNVFQAALSTYKLTLEQLSSWQCDVITGFHIEDTNQHIVMLEGLKEGGVKTLWEELPRHCSQDEDLKKVFYNSEFGFSQRLYGTFDVDLPRIRLYYPLKSIVQFPLIYIQGKIPPASFRALMCLNELRMTNLMADIARNNLFPTAEEVAALSLQFGIPSISSPLTTDERAKEEEKEEGHTPQRPMTPYLKPRTKRVSLYLDANNPEYEEALRERRRSRTKEGENFIQSNIAHCEALSDLTRHRYPMRQTHIRSQSENTGLPVYNYSSQAKNSVQHTLTSLREDLQPNRRYTLCQEYLFGNFDPTNPEAKMDEERLRSAQQWSVKEKFVYPGVPSALESNAHPMRPDSARIKELAEPFQDKHPSVCRLRSTLDRFQLSAAAEGKPDFDLLKVPPSDMFGSLPASVHLIGDEWEEVQKEVKRRECETWKERVIVDDIHFHTHRRGVGTELSPKAGSRLDSIKGMLKDPPKKLSLKKTGFNLTIPHLSVTQNQPSNFNTPVNILSVGEGLGEEHCIGYQPGPYDNRSLKNSCNVIPRNYPMEAKSLPIHPQPFRLYYHTHKSLCHYPNKPRPSEVPQAPPMFINKPGLQVSVKNSDTGQEPDQHLEQTAV